MTRVSPVQSAFYHQLLDTPKKKSFLKRFLCGCSCGTPARGSGAWLKQAMDSLKVALKKNSTDVDRLWEEAATALRERVSVLYPDSHVSFKAYRTCMQILLVDDKGNRIQGPAIEKKINQLFYRSFKEKLGLVALSATAAGTTYALTHRSYESFLPAWSHVFALFGLITTQGSVLSALHQNNDFLPVKGFFIGQQAYFLRAALQAVAPFYTGAKQIEECSFYEMMMAGNIVPGATSLVRSVVVEPISQIRQLRPLANGINTIASVIGALGGLGQGLGMLAFFGNMAYRSFYPKAPPRGWFTF
ncbi:MAG: hypothetical protein RLZZ453_1025 [Chlamydiota bacterium]|jgi:hypothetical protein